MKISTLITISLLFIISLSRKYQNLLPSSLFQKIVQIDGYIHNYDQMNFLNLIPNKQPSLSGQKSQPKQLFEQLKIRRFSANKIDVSDQIQKIESNLMFKDSTLSSQVLNQQANKILMQNLVPVSTFGIPCKRSEGINLLNYVVFGIFDSFYSLQGQKIFNAADIGNDLTEGPEKSLISSARNQYLYIAKYVGSSALKTRQECPNLKIQHLLIKNKQMSVNDRLQSTRLVIQSQDCQNLNQDHDGIYTNFFTFNSFPNKKDFYILTNSLQVHFYFYSEKAQQLILDRNRTIKVQVLFQGISGLPETAQRQQIHRIVKLNTHLVILTRNNKVFSINLVNHLGSKRRQSVLIYQSLPLRFQKMHEIVFNDNDFRQFYVLSDENIYHYQVSHSKIQNKFQLAYSYCPPQLTQQPCTKSVYILEKYILVQNRYSTKQKRVQLNDQLNLIQKQTRLVFQFYVPFSHERKCSQVKKILVSKNKNSQYIITLACFLAQTQRIDTGQQINITLSRQQISNTLSRKEMDNNPRQQMGNKSRQQVSNRQRPYYVILQHLSLQTTNQISASGRLNSIDFTKFRLPLIVFSIGLVFYITIKRSNKTEPQKEDEQNLNKKLEEEVIQKIKRERERQEHIKAIPKKQ